MVPTPSVSTLYNCKATFSFSDHMDIEINIHIFSINYAAPWNEKATEFLLITWLAKCIINLS